MSSVTLGGSAVTALTLTVPGVGLWYADVAMQDAAEMSGQVELIVLDTSWQGCVIAGAVVDGRSRYRVVAGSGGWGRELPPKAYANDAGVTSARAIQDAADEAGETVADAPTGENGVHFNRPRGPASFALNLFAPRGWYARPDGVVTFGARPTLPAPPLAVTERNPADRSVTLAATTSLAGVEPGTTTEFGAARDVEISLGQYGIAARLYAAPAAPSRRLAAWTKLLDALDPQRRFRGVHEYRIVNQTGERLNLQPIRSRAELPDLARVPVRMGVPGVRANHTPGGAVLVAFLEGDPTRPVVVGFDAPDSPGWMPLQIELGGPTPLGVARVTDPVVAGPFGGTIVSGSARVKASL